MKDWTDPEENQQETSSIFGEFLAESSSPSPQEEDEIPLPPRLREEGRGVRPYRPRSDRTLPQPPLSPSPSPNRRSPNTLQTNPNAPRDAIPEDRLGLMVSWLNNMASQEDLARAEEYVKNHRKKQEVFNVQLAISRASLLEDLFRIFRQQVAPEALRPDRLGSYSNSQILLLMDIMHRVFDREAQYQFDFLQKGPQELPTIIQNQSLTLNLQTNGELSDDATEILDKFSKMKPKSRERMRQLLEAVTKYGKAITAAGEDDEK